MIILANNAGYLFCSRYVFGAKEASVGTSEVDEHPECKLSRSEYWHASQTSNQYASVGLGIRDENGNVV
jgi:hypothetical protein